MTFEYTRNTAVAGARRVHALQGGGEGLNGAYIKGLTWCGVEKHSKMMLVETRSKVTCKRCLNALAAHESIKGDDR